jgi:copper(I)-binding protein
MKMRILAPALLALALTAAAIYSFAQNAQNGADAIVVKEAWARATPPGASVGAIYVSIENRGDAEDQVISVESSAADSAMLHATVEEEGISQMRESEGRIAPSGTLKMEPGGTHIMLMGLSKPLMEGETVDVTLNFDKAGKVTIDATVTPVGSASPMQAMD